jgi:hypothetical protein
MQLKPGQSREGCEGGEGMLVFSLPTMIGRFHFVDFAVFARPVFHGIVPV